MNSFGGLSTQAYIRRQLGGYFQNTHKGARRISTTRPLCKATNGRPPATKHYKDKINYNSEVFFNERPDPHHTDYTRVTANDLECYTSPPRGVKMLVRDFIEDSLYNPNYGYFPKQVTIFTSSDTAIDFTALRHSVEFQNEVSKRYSAYGADENGPGRQIWHTPTELFKVKYSYPCAETDH